MTTLVEVQKNLTVSLYIDEKTGFYYVGGAGTGHIKAPEALALSFAADGRVADPYYSACYPLFLLQSLAAIPEIFLYIPLRIGLPRESLSISQPLV